MDRVLYFSDDKKIEVKNSDLIITYNKPDEYLKSVVKSELKIYQKYPHPYFPKIKDMQETGDTLLVRSDFFEGINIGNYLRMFPDDGEVILGKMLWFCRYLKYFNVMLSGLSHEKILVNKIDDEVNIRIYDVKTDILDDEVDNYDNTPLSDLALIFLSIYREKSDILNLIKNNQEIKTPFSDKIELLCNRILLGNLKVDDISLESISELYPNPVPVVKDNVKIDSFSSFHKAVCDTFYSKNIHYNLSFELFDKYYLNGKLHPLKSFQTPPQKLADIDFSTVISDKTIYFKSGKPEILVKKKKVKNFESIEKALDQIYTSLKKWDFDNFHQGMRWIESNLDEITSLSVTDFFNIHRLFIDRNYSISQIMLDKYLQLDFSDDDKGLIYYKLLGLNFLSEIIQREVVDTYSYYEKYASDDIKNKISELREFKEFYINKDYDGFVKHIKNRKLSKNLKSLAFQVLEITRMSYDKLVKDKIFEKFANDILRDSNPQDVVNLLVRANHPLKLPKVFLDYLSVLALKLKSDFQLSKVLFYMIYSDENIDFSMAEQALLIYKFTAIDRIPDAMKKYIDYVEIVVNMHKEKFGKVSSGVKKYLAKHGKNSLLAVRVYNIIVKVLNHDFNFSSSELKEFLDNNHLKSQINENYNFIHTIKRHGKDDQKKLLKDFTVSEEMDLNIKLSNLYDRKKYVEVVRLLTHAEPKGKYEKAECYFYAAKANLKLKKISMANRLFQNSRRYFSLTGLNSRVKEIEFEIARLRELSEITLKNDWTELIIKFSKIDSLEEFILQMEKVYKLNFNFDVFIPFVYDKKRESFLSVRKMINKRATSILPLDFYSSMIFGVYSSNKDKSVVYLADESSPEIVIQGMKVYSAICVPVFAQNRLFGAVYLHSFDKSKEISEEETDKIYRISSILGIFLEKLYEKELENRIENIEVQNNFHGIVGRSEKMKEVYRNIITMAKVPFPVLIFGETGTGKELVARALYREGNFKGKLVSLNVNTIPESLFESELFGHVKGAFTGANETTRGRIGEASGGVLFLDEIGELSLSVQKKLLRVLQERSYWQVGGKSEIKTDARFVFATNKDLKKEVEKGNFREDLYYRISTFVINLPPLRERRDDIPELVKYFTDKFLEMQPDININKISSSKLSEFVDMEWAGNIRELENTIYRTLLLPDVEQKKEECDEIFSISSSEIHSLDELSIKYLTWRKDILGDLKKLWKELSISKSAYYRLMSKFGNPKNGKK